MKQENICIECMKRETELGEQVFLGTPLQTISYAKYARTGNRLYRGTQRLNIMTPNIPIYIHIPKTAGRYFLQTAREKGIDINFSAHSPAKYVRDCVPTYDSEYSFAVVRNPYERFYSACKHNDISDPLVIEDLSNQMLTNINWSSEFNCFHFEHFFTQKHFVVGHDNETCIVSHIGRYENLPELITKLKTHGIDIEAEFVEEPNTSFDWQTVLSQQTIANISKIYAEDFAYFLYPLL